MGYGKKTPKPVMAKKAHGYSSGGIAQKKATKAVKPKECKAGASYKG